MKHFISFIMCALLCALFPSPASAQIKEAVSLEKALTLAQGRFEGQDVDYYLVGNSKNDVWSIFVDAEPQKGWEHECYLINVSKSKTLNEVPRMEEKELRLPPEEDIVPLIVKNRMGSRAKDKPYVSNSFPTVVTDFGEQTHNYAIILSGGVNKNCNYERYWNDCSYIYQVLIRKYGIPKSNICVIMADGTDPSADMRTTDGEYKSSPLDLDGDGTADIKYSATLANIHSVLNQFHKTIEQDDHLLFYVIDHGGTNDGKTKSYINLWGNEKLQDYTLAQWLKPILNKNAVVNCVLGQCFSGGFIDDLRTIGCVVSTAAAGNEYSWACSDRPYDEFVYQWTSAINEQDTYNNKIVSDVDKNGRVTMEEAFAYAKGNDRRVSEHPQFQSIPLSVGEDLAFNHLAPSVDIYVKDNAEDTGKEPNATTTMLWDSPSICVRNNPDSIFIHENPVYTSDHRMAYIYVRIYNRGREDFRGRKYLHIYWALSSTGISSKVFKGRETYEGKFLTGKDLEAYPIPPIEAGSYKDIEINWSLPQMLANDNYGKFHFAVLAKIMDKPYDDGYVEGKTYFNVAEYNDQAIKNVAIINREGYDFFPIFVRNLSKANAHYSLELRPRREYDKGIFSKANIEMEMSPKIYEAWERGGFQSEDIASSNGSNANNQRTVKYLTPQSKLKNICLKGEEFDIVNMKFDFYHTASKDSDYIVDLIQRDENGNIIGGQTFIIEPPLQSQENIYINSVPVEDNKFQLEIDDTVGCNSIKWVNGNNEVIGTDNTITVAPTVNDNKYSVYVMDKNGYVKTGSISLDVKQYIQTVYIQTNNIFVNLKAPAPINAEISIISLSDGTTIKSIVPEGEDEISIDASALSSGVFVVNYMINHEIVDKKKINIK